MSKAAPPLLGFNNNVRHRGRIFHIQTEDSGVKAPRIVTHLFADGGRIVKTTRTDYSEHVDKVDMAAVVRGMMKEQHKAMFAALRAGDMDSLLENACGPLEPAKAKPQEPASDPTATRDLDSARVIVGPAKAKTKPPPAPARPPEPIAAAAQLVPPGAPAADVAQGLLEGPRSLRDGEGAASLRRPMSNPNLRRPTPSVSPPGAGGFDLDVASLDKNPPRTASPPSVRSRKSNPPPRQGVPPSSRKSVPPPSRKSVPPSSRKTNPPPRPPIPARSPTAVSAAPGPLGAAAAAASSVSDQSSSSVGRPTRLAAAPPAKPRSIFGDGAISEQSLDEVILSYLAEDLEETK